MDYKELYQEYILRLQRVVSGIHIEITKGNTCIVKDLRDLGVRQCKVLRKLLARSGQPF